MKQQMKKWIFALMLPCAVGGFALTKNGATFFKFEVPDGWVSGMSDNGKWGVWEKPSDSSDTPCPDLLDLTTGEVKKFIFDYDPANMQPHYVADVSNDGKWLAGTYGGKPALFDTEALMWRRVFSGRADRNKQGSFSSVSPDGRYAVGYYSNGGSMTDFKGILADYSAFVDKVGEESDRQAVVYEFTEKLPTHKDMYDMGVITKQVLDEHLATQNNDGSEREPVVYPNSYIFKVSADGKKLLIGLDHNYPNWGCCYVVFDRETETYDWILPEEVLDSPYRDSYVGETIMSNNGRYVYGTGIYFSEDQQEHSVHFIYDTETKTYENVEAGEVTVIGNDKTLYCAAGLGTTIRSLTIPVNGLDVDIHQILKQGYDIDFLEETGWTTTGYAVGVSDDNTSLLAQAEMRNSAYYVKLDKHFKEAAGVVNPLNDWMVTPVANSRIARLKTIEVVFAQGCSPVEGVKASIMDGDNAISTSTGVRRASNSTARFYVDFPETALAEGKTYRIVLPKGMFAVEGTSLLSPEVSTTYVGRKEEPLAYKTVSPEPGTAIREIGMQNPIRLDFPELLTINPDAPAATISETGSDYTMSTLMAETANGVLFLYTPSAHFLAKDKSYTLHIPANYVTDIMGYCGNEEFTLEFDGAYEYVPKRGFEEDFNDISKSLGSFLQYEGDHNTPVDGMVAWGFDTDNTPWNFSINDGDRTDFAAGSHSMYKPAGKSDDWMVIPSMKIDNADYFLKFKGQSYLNGKNDVLKIYVWESDELLNSLSREIVEKMRSEGKLIFNQKLEPGENENNLANEWQEFDLSLAEFNGKRVYIAFVNENENQSAIFIDDVIVNTRSNYVVGSVSEEIVTDQDELEVRGGITNNSGATVTGFSATFESLNNGSKGSMEVTGIDLKNGETYNFTFPEKMKLEKGIENTYEIVVTVGTDKMTATGRVKNLKYNFTKKVVVEEGTGAWCGNCPLGALALENLNKVLPDNVVTIGVHAGGANGYDPYDYSAYAQFMGFTAYPTGRVNRGADMLSPMYGGADNYYFVSPEGDKTFYDAVLKELQTPADTKITIKDAYYSTVSKQIEIDPEVEFAIAKTGINYNILPVILEDELPIMQHNYFYNQTFSGLGEWNGNGELGSQGEYASTTADHVARAIGGGSFYGLGGIIPRNVETDQVYTYSPWGQKRVINVDYPSNMTHTVKAEGQPGGANPKASVALIVIDAATGRVINADIWHGLESKDISGVDTIIGDEINGVLDVDFTVADGRILANGSADGVEVFNLDGTRVSNNGLRGLFIVRALDANGNTATAKILVK